VASSSSSSVFGDLRSGGGLAALNAHLRTRSYIEGYSWSEADVQTWHQVPNQVDMKTYPHISRWWSHIASFTIKRGPAPAPVPVRREDKKSGGSGSSAKGAAANATATPSKTAPAKASKREAEPEPEPAAPADMDFDSMMAGGDEPDPEVEKLMKKRAAEAAEKKKIERATAEKASAIIDVKPEGDEIDMKELEEKVRAIKKDGLEWTKASLIPVVKNIKKLRIIAIVPEGDDQLLEELQEEIEKIEGVQSTDFKSGSIML